MIEKTSLHTKEDNYIHLENQDRKVFQSNRLRNAISPGLKSSWLKSLGLKGPGLKLGVEKSGVEMSFNLIYDIGRNSPSHNKVLVLYQYISKMYFTVLGIHNFDIRWICDTSEEFAQQDPCLYSGCYATNCQLQIG